MSSGVGESGLPLINRAAAHAARTAIVDDRGAHTYGEVLATAGRVAAGLLAGVPTDGHAAAEAADLRGARVAFMAPTGLPYVAALWGTWRAGGVAVPLGLSHPVPELEFVLDDAAAAIVLAHPDFEGTLRPLAAARGIRFGRLDAMEVNEGRSLPTIGPDRRAMILYTSGTTSQPKGVVLTHENLAAQIESLVEAWEWAAEDRILHVLPLHHTHGIVNALLCPLWCGATCEMMPRFDAETVWRRWIAGGITLFMAVPTIYVRLISAWEAAAPEDRARMSRAAAALRVMISGSAALPVQVFHRWGEISGQALLERYGMTEIGMGLSNPLRGERRPGTVGKPMPGVSVQIVDESGARIEAEATPGELQVAGPSVFREYWNRPEATAVAFADGWFRTGDQTVVEDGYFRLLGRTSVDILKTGGYKVSALEIEEALRTHPAIAECAVVGAPDPEWGERVCAAVVPAAGGSLSLEELRRWARGRLAPYKVPTRLRLVEDLPRNPMGKVTKPDVKRLFEGPPSTSLKEAP
jgi:malonyl-CoA/methylmalonyl-CoA synthetase